MEDKYIKLSDAKNAIADYIAEQTVSKYGSLEACRDAKFAAKGAMKELDYIPTADVVPKSEVERLQAEGECLRNANADLALALLYECEPTKEHLSELEKAVREKIAREIFAEIEKYAKRPIPESKAVYILKQNVIDELKKKYIPQDCPTCKHFVGCEQAVWTGLCEDYKGVDT